MIDPETQLFGAVSAGRRSRTATRFARWVARVFPCAAAVAMLAGCGAKSAPFNPDESPAALAANAAALDWCVGAWAGVRRAADDGSEEPIRLVVRALRGGAGHVERLQVDLATEPYVGFTVRVPEGSANRWTMHYANDRRERIARLDGTIDGAKSAWIAVDPERTRESLLVSERTGPDTWRRQQLISEDDGATWTVLFTDELTRATTEPRP